MGQEEEKGRDDELRALFPVYDDHFAPLVEDDELGPGIDGEDTIAGKKKKKVS